MIEAKVNNGCTDALGEDSSVELWHKWLGIMSDKGLRVLAKRGTMAGVTRFDDGEFIILLLYIDDMLIVGQNSEKVDKLKAKMKKYFDMKYLGPSKHILGMSICRDRKEHNIWLSQEKYIEKVLEHFHMERAKPIATPLASHFCLSSKQSPTTKIEKQEMNKVPYASVVRSLMYAMVCTRTYITHVIGVVSRILADPRKEHWNVMKWILQYLRGTSKMNLCFGSRKPELIGYTDGDMVGNIDSRKSTSGFLITFLGGVVWWQSKLQKCVTLSSIEAEFIAITEDCKEILWMKRFLNELGQEQ